MGMHEYEQIVNAIKRDLSGTEALKDITWMDKRLMKEVIDVGKAVLKAKWGLF